jgi:exopolysaccharide biosynthesis polyprenyl glycosylphosphotransferase
MVSTAKSFPFPLRESTPTADHVWTATNAYILDEFHFVRMLRVERNRTERSGKPFMLMLLSGNEGLFQSSDVLSDVVSAVANSTRETDTLGWYETGVKIGILFTELGEIDRATIEKIVEKVSSALQEKLDLNNPSDLTVTYHVFPEDVGAHGKHETDVRLYPDLERMAAKKKGAQAIKRMIDVLGSLAAIVFLSPIFLAIALAVKLTSKGPVLFRQKRIGQYGKSFTFLKFRSMKADNDPTIHQEYVKKLIAGQPDIKQNDGKDGSFKLVNDPRVTPIGKFIRRTSLDELPQFFNVLAGDMSLVGPRPPVPYEYQAYDVWHRRRVVEVRPGITGLWQVKGRSKTSFDEMVRLDLRYAQSWSVGMDLKILLETPKAVVSGSGAY